MFYILYRTTNSVTGKFYIGIHKTPMIEDGYLGSGKLLRRAVKKHGPENFTREVLQFFDTEEEMLRKEEEIVTFDFIANNDVYNLMPGGSYGSKDRNGLTFEGRSHTDESRKKIGNGSRGSSHSEESKKKMSDNNFSKREPGRHLEHVKKLGSLRKTEAHKRAIGEALKGRKGHTLNKGKTREKVKCPRCGKEGAKNVMFRWHFENCAMV